MPTTVGCIMAQHQTSCLAAVLTSLCITFIPGGTTGCTGEPTCMFCVDFWIAVVVPRMTHATIKYHRCVLILSVDGYSLTGLVLTSSVSGRNACPSEEVTFTCTTQGTALFWGNEAFGEKTMHYMSFPTRGKFRAEIVRYDRNQSCLVSSLSFRATASHNGTTVTCTNRDRSSSQSLSLHIMSSKSVRHFLTVSC